MKKIIAIALIAITAFAAFAATEGRIKVTYTVEDDEPTFTLKTGTSISVDAGDSSTAVPTAADAASVSQALADGTDGEVEFTISQSGGRSQKKYKLSVTVTDLILKDSTSGDQMSSPSANQKFTAKDVANMTKYGTAVTNLSLDVPSATKNVVTADYSGKVASSDVATFKAQWNANTKAVQGDYIAYVKLTVETV